MPHRCLVVNWLETYSSRRYSMRSPPKTQHPRKKTTRPESKGQFETAGPRRPCVTEATSGGPALWSGDPWLRCSLAAVGRRGWPLKILYCIRIGVRTGTGEWAGPSIHPYIRLKIKLTHRTMSTKVKNKW